ncbi:MAG: YihY/virulence factor BrkB family protein [Treponema sp.]|nr:YihY/virulence factor BrkB family protein [Treponema sp.]
MHKKKSSNPVARKHKVTLTTFMQSLFLAGNFFVSNNLVSYASACAFGFLFSFIPVLMMILVVLIRFMHAAPDTVIDLINSNVAVESYFNIESFANSLLQIHTITNFEIVLAVSIIWMARRFFNSVMSGLNCVFRNQLKPRPMVRQFMVFGGEAIIVVTVAVIVFLSMTLRTIRRTSILDNLAEFFPWLDLLTGTIVNLTPFALLFLSIAFVLRMGSRTKPPLVMCMAASAGNTLVFWAFRKLMVLFIDVNRYNLVYGVLSNVIVLLLEMFFFFIIFLFFAQWLYVVQFFDILLLSELYLLPDHDNTSIPASLRRILFIRPDSLLRKDTASINVRKGEFIYKNNEIGTDAYYLAQGTVQIYNAGHFTFIDRGKFFGEEACMFSGIRSEDAVAYTDVSLVRIPAETFFELLDRNPKVSRKALSQISNYFAKFYGRTEENFI